MKEMKDSGIEWIGKIPANWQISKLKYECGGFTNGFSGTQIAYGETEFPVSRIETISSEKIDMTKVGYVKKIPSRYKLNTNDFLISNINSIAKLGNCAQYTENANLYHGMNLLRVIPKQINPRFLSYFFYSPCFKKAMQIFCKPAINQASVSAQNVKNIHIANCGIEEQIKIADFLDRKCSEIDALTADIQTQIDTLEEYKKSVITEAVTKGLDPNVEMKDSGVEWIGMIPADWDVFKGKYVLKYLQKPVKQEDDVITCFRDGEVTLRKNRREDGFTMSDKEIGYQGVDVGDLVVHGMDGFAGAIGISDSRGKASPVLNILDSSMMKKYIMYYLRSMAYGNVFTAIATGIRVRSCDLRWNKLANLPYPIPPYEEQLKIADFIDEKCSEIDLTISEKQQQLETLAEYKKSLIYEYVTGKREVA